MSYILLIWNLNVIVVKIGIMIRLILGGAGEICMQL